MLSLTKTKINLLLTLSSWCAAIGQGRRIGPLQLWLLRAAGVRTTGPLVFGRQVDIHEPGKLVLGARVAIGPNSRLMCWEEITIGDDFLGAAGLHVDTGAHDPETLKPANKPIHIGRRVWCGTRVTICAGASVGDDVVLGAGAVVVDSIPSGVVAVGVPARPIRTLNRKPDGGPPWSIWER